MITYYIFPNTPTLSLRRSTSNINIEQANSPRSEKNLHSCLRNELEHDPHHTRAKPEYKHERASEIGSQLPWEKFLR
jgi:hypothetical protein